jgi:predicted transcriptional regulator
MEGRMRLTKSQSVELAANRRAELLAYVTKHPGQKKKQIAHGLGLHVQTVSEYLRANPDLFSEGVFVKAEVNHG